VDTVTIRIPASPQYLQVVRLVASGLATRIGFTLEDIDDLKHGVDELSAYLTGAKGREGTLEINFEVDESKIEITGIARLAPGDKVRTDLTEFSQMILDTVADSASLAMKDGAPVFQLVKSKKPAELR
jgi:serine/threonine-protein kinase RsbW